MSPPQFSIKATCGRPLVQDRPFWELRKPGVGQVTTNINPWTITSPSLFPLKGVQLSLSGSPIHDLHGTGHLADNSWYFYVKPTEPAQISHIFWSCCRFTMNMSCCRSNEWNIWRKHERKAAPSMFERVPQPPNSSCNQLPKWMHFPFVVSATNLFKSVFVTCRPCRLSSRLQTSPAPWPFLCHDPQPI